MARGRQKSDGKFRGPNAISLDSKNRLAVPTVYREIFQEISQGRVVVTAHPHGCLLLYPADTWYPVEESIMSKPSLDMQVAEIQELVVGMAVEGIIDITGRVLLPIELREYADLEKEIIMIGQHTHFKIWSKTAWSAKTKARKPEPGKVYPMPESFGSFNL